MQRRHLALTIRLTDAGLRQDWHPILTAISSSGLESIHRETSRETSDATEYAFEGLGEMVRDVIFEDLNGGNPGRALVSDLSFAADAHNRRIVVQAVDERRQRIRVYPRIRVDLRHRSA